MAQNQEVAASLLAFNYLDPTILNEQLDRMIQAGIKNIHYDVMDGKFTNSPVPFGSEHIDTLYLKGFKIDVHLMVNKPWKYTGIYLKYPGDSITFHVESCHKCLANMLIRRIHKAKRLVGVAIKLDTDISQYRDIIKKCDLVTIMGVNPGFGGQHIDMAQTLSQLQGVNKIKREDNPKLKIMIDGGVNDSVAKTINDLADIFISGSYLVKLEHPEDFVKLVHNL